MTLIVVNKDGHNDVIAHSSNTKTAKYEKTRPNYVTPIKSNTSFYAALQHVKGSAALVCCSFIPTTMPNT